MRRVSTVQLVEGSTRVLSTNQLKLQGKGVARRRPYRPYLGGFCNHWHARFTSSASGGARRLYSHSTQTAPRIYEYEVDEHGQLFLSDTKIKNFTSCYKDQVFLDFFYTRLRRNTLDDKEGRRLRGEGYEWVSPCGDELNFIKASCSPVVYQELSVDGVLSYAGTLSTPFLPSSLLADPQTGYLYHPSPSLRQTQLTNSRSSKRTEDKYGRYSLLKSALVLAHFKESLEVDESGEGRLVWMGKECKFGRLEGGDAG